MPYSMANTTKNRLFSGDMELNNTQGKSMPIRIGAFLVSERNSKNGSKQPLKNYTTDFGS